MIPKKKTQTQYVVHTCKYECFENVYVNFKWIIQAGHRACKWQAGNRSAPEGQHPFWGEAFMRALEELEKFINI